jgi:periplasmic copper chaperone A
MNPLDRRSLLAALLWPWPALAHEYHTESFRIVHPWAEPTAEGATTADVYLRVEDITADDRLIAARSSIAKEVVIRRGAQTLKAIVLRAGQGVDLLAVGIRLELIGLNVRLRKDRSYPLTLVFEKAGAVETMLSIGEH